MKSFWNDLKKPISILAPMEDVTDVVFREIILSTARPDVFFTEFTNCEGLFSIGRDVCIERLKYSNNEHPIIAQLWGVKLENIYKGVQLAEELGFDGVDLNMGCPHKNVVKLHGGAALIIDPTHASELIDSAIKASRNIPISVKTRLGYSTIQTEDWIGMLLQKNISALTIHGRIAKQMSNGSADWSEIKKAVSLRDKINKNIIIIGNGDVVDYADGIKKCRDFHTDGFMIGRGIFNNLYAFSKDNINRQGDKTYLLNKFLKHTLLYKKNYGENRSIGPLKHFAKTYINGYEGASEMREKVYSCNDLNTLEQTLISLI